MLFQKGLRPKSEYSSIREAVGYTLAQELKWTGPVDPKRLITHWMDHFPSAAVEMPGASAMVQALHRKGIAMGVISNGAEHSRRRTLAALPFGETIETMICSEACCIAKPAPEIFHPWPASITPAERSIKTLEGLLEMLTT
ncbi:HAD family hydrolase [Pseudomonas ogarae]|uniref:HAD family hydrolase n=1 Tax=Pseudomonas ogarae (strain DSM 112162 / CECT 30235 / F113) TaxID=1114970 RepID=UPI002E112E6F